MPDLTGKQKRYLRGLAHHLDPVVYVGNAGLSTALVAKTSEELDNHELIKVKVGENSPLGRKEVGPRLAEATGAALVQILGKIVILYRAREEKEGESTPPKIELPE